MSSDSEDRLEKIADRWDATAQARLENPIRGWMDSSIVLKICVDFSSLRRPTTDVRRAARAGRERDL